ncbi:hypothetical protein [Paenibacillus daejeonensis]|uniref:hypothetical protein n=1 Tax=Paenibacillus daejeonensis TaxID=135193 RepID=UPI000375D448|nr:hypothetical protein [Paenibacillus daejeonensis]
MKSKKTIITTFVAVALLVSGYIYADSKVISSNISAFSFYHSTLDELEDRTELIVSGSPISSKNHVTYDEEGFKDESFTITDFKIEKVYKNNLKNGLNIDDVIKVAEPIYIVDRGLVPGKIEFSPEGYNKMDGESRYLLVLRPDLTYPDLNVIVGTNQGIYNIDNDANIMSRTDNAVGFKQELIEKYGVE